MGSWGYGPFDNDAAADLLAFVEESGAGGWRLVRDALYSKYPQDVIGAAELVALAVGQGTRRDERALPLAVGRQTAVPWVRSYGRLMPADLPSLALDMCRTALAHSRKTMKRAPKQPRTLRGMKIVNVFLDEGESAKKWQATISSLIRRLERGRRRRQS
jgi:hypothetical protein